jgi:acetate kinase
MAILVLNCGSSSIKYTLYDWADGHVLNHGNSDRVTDYDESLEAIFSDLETRLQGGLSSIRAVGHRVVHGGRSFLKPHIIDPDVLEVIRTYSNLAPLHNPPNIAGIEFATRRLPSASQVAVFDTSFHSSIPPEAHHYAIPAAIAKKYRISRYGFHGTSHKYVHDRAALLCGFGDDPTGLSIITCHLGNGCSVSAVRDGKCLDTSMGFTPLEGLVMGSRTGDMDPAIVLFLMGPFGGSFSFEQVNQILNWESGLKGLSELSSDVRDLLEARSRGHEGAALALSVFAYRLKKYICAYHGILSGADALVFTAGIGENSPEVRSEALTGLESIGIALDEEKNASVRGAEAEITGRRSRTRIFVIPTDEDLMIYRETLKILENNQ